MICADHPDLPPVLDPWAFTYSCRECGSRDLVPDVLDVIRDARRAHMAAFGEPPASLRLGRARADRLLHLAPDLGGVVFGMAWAPDDIIDPDEVVTEGGDG